MSDQMVAYFEQRNEATAGSDRVSAIVYGAAVQDALQAALKTFLLRNQSHANNLLTADGPLGNWGLMNDLAHSTGLISDDVWHDLDQIRRIRNRFAHWGTMLDATRTPKPVTFSTDTNKNRAASLKCPEVLLRTDFGEAGDVSGATAVLKLPESEQPKLPPPTDPRERFECTCERLIHLLSRAEIHHRSVESRVTPFDYPSLNQRGYSPDPSNEL